jgi:hypothetical protein
MPSKRISKSITLSGPLQGHYQLIISIFEPGKKFWGKGDYASIADYSVEFQIVKNLAVQDVGVFLTNVVKCANPDGSLDNFGVITTLNIETRDNDW